MIPDPSIIKSDRAIVRLVYESEVTFARWERGRLTAYEGDPFALGQPGERELDPQKARLLAPCRPSKVVAVGLNYRAHADELGLEIPTEPMLFIKPSTSVVGPGAPIIRPAGATRVDHEAELGVVMGRFCSKVSKTNAKQYVLGYTCLNDVTERDMQARDVQYTRAKGFDTFCPLGPAIALDVKPGLCEITARVNGGLRQESNTTDMIFTVSELISFISHVMTLLPGDVIATGTPSGISPLVDGDEVEIEVEGIGVLRNPVVDA